MKFKPFEKKIWLSSPTMHGEELEHIKNAYKTNWMSTIGSNINEVENITCNYVGCKYSVALSTGTAALHLSIKLAGIKFGDKVFCSDMTFSATINPIVYEGGIPVFIDSEYETWNMDPKALQKAFEIYPNVKTVIVVNLYGTPAKLDEIRRICNEHNAVLIEDAAESLGAIYKGKQTGTFGDYNIISFNGNKIITGSTGGILLTDNFDAVNNARKWSTQARENAPWYQHNEIGFNYRMSNVIAGVIRGQYAHLDEHISQKKIIYNRYKEGLKDLPVSMNPYIHDRMEPNHWLSCLTINRSAMCEQTRTEQEAVYISELGKSCPTEILEVLTKYNAEGRPVWKPMHMQPIFKMSPFITKDGDGKLIKDVNTEIVNEDIFERGLCLPSDNKMTEAQQTMIINIIRSCFE